MTTPTEELFTAIANQSPDTQTQLAMLVGSYGESGWDPYAQGSGGGGAFGFTPPNYPAALETAPPSTQVRAIRGSYAAAESQVPSNVTNQAAAAEYQALAAERPKGSSAEMSSIAATDKPVPYGASSYDVSNWPQVVKVAKAYPVGAVGLAGAPTNVGLISGSGTSSLPSVTSLEPQLPSEPGGILNPFNWGISAANATIRALWPVMIFVLGLILVAWGLGMTFKGDDKITLNTPPAPAPEKTAPEKSAVATGTEEGAETAAVAA